MKRLVFCWAWLALLAVAGCGGPGPVPVTGTVTYQGQPVADVNVTFLGADGLVATGSTDAQGQFANLRPHGSGEGALPGEYRVTITPKSNVSDDPSGAISYEMVSRPPFPNKYLTLETTDLTATVATGSDNHFPFELTD
jgi:hypothetical protein